MRPCTRREFVGAAAAMLAAFALGAAGGISDGRGDEDDEPPGAAGEEEGMRALVVGSDRKIERGVELTHAEAVELSAMAWCAAVVDMAETVGGRRAVYVGGKLRQYDPVENELC